jgi:hypothetical protein
MMKGTPCSRRCRASLKTLGKTRYLARSSNPAKRVRAWAQGGSDWPGADWQSPGERKRKGPFHGRQSNGKTRPLGDVLRRVPNIKTSETRGEP